MMTAPFQTKAAATVCGIHAYDNWFVFSPLLRLCASTDGSSIENKC